MVAANACKCYQWSREGTVWWSSSPGFLLKGLQCFDERSVWKQNPLCRKGSTANICQRVKREIPCATFLHHHMTCLFDAPNLCLRKLTAAHGDSENDCKVISLIMKSVVTFQLYTCSCFFPEKLHLEWISGKERTPPHWILRAKNETTGANRALLLPCFSSRQKDPYDNHW